MSKRKRTSEIEKWIKQGRGSAREKIISLGWVFSLGRSTRLKGIKTSRQLESNFLY